MERPGRILIYTTLHPCSERIWRTPRIDRETNRLVTKWLNQKWFVAKRQLMASKAIEWTLVSMD